MTPINDSPPTNVPVIMSQPGSHATIALATAKRAGSDPHEQQALTLTFVWRAFQQWWKVAIPAGLVLATGAAIAVLSMFNPQYQATAWLMIQHPSGIVTPDGGIKTSPQFVRTQVTLITTPVILAPALEKLGQIDEVKQTRDPIDWLQKNVKVTSVGGSDVYRIDCSSHRPENAFQIVTAVLAVYMDHHRGESDKHKLQTIKLLKGAEAARKSVIEGLKDKVKRLAEEIGGQDPLSRNPVDVANVIAPVASLRARLINVEVEREVLKAQIGSVDQSLRGRPKAVAEAVIEAQIDANSDVQQGMLQLLAMRSRLAEIERKVIGGTKNEHYKEYEQKVQAQEKELAALRQNHRENLKRQPAAEGAEPETEFSRLKQRVVGLNAEYKLLKTRLDEQLEELKKKGGNSALFEFERGELAARKPSTSKSQLGD